MKKNICFFSLSIALLSLSSTIVAQDSRKVTEPVLPPVCTVLESHLSAAGGGLAAADEAKLDTARIQKALDGCAKGHGVELRLRGESNAFLTGPLQLRQGVTLIVSKGVTLFASLDAALYNKYPGSCGVVLPERNPSLSDPIAVHEIAAGYGCKPLILIDHVSNAGIMGDGVIDGRGDSKILGKDITWWDLNNETHKSPHLERFCPRMIEAHHANDFTMYRITLKNAPHFHVSYDHGDGFTVWGIKIDTMERVARKNAPNTDGIDPGNGSKDITITHSYIRDGDDNVAFTGGLSNATVSHNHFYWGHGMSIGSVVTKAGVSNIRVFDLSMDGTDSGIRLKSSASRGGLVHDVVYDDVCVRNSRNPITLSTDYGQTKSGGQSAPLFPEYGEATLPSFSDITLHNVRVSGGGKISFSGYSHDYRAAVKLDGVLLTDADTAKYTYAIDHADLHLGPGPVNLQTSGGTDSTVSGKAGTGSLPSCADKFVPFPQMQ